MTHRILRLASPSLALLLVLTPPAASGAEAERPWWAPDKAFGQFGAAQHAKALTVGVVWESGWHHPLARGKLSVYTEASLGRWRATLADGASSSSGVSQFGITPVLRWTRGEPAAWFLELGIGANVLTPLYRSGNKIFSTAFNFGDHLAVGWLFGDRSRHELVLRFQHFSNAGIRQPNPGENFLQLRYVHGF